MPQPSARFQTHFTDQAPPLELVDAGHQVVTDTPSVLTRGPLPRTYDDLVIPIVGPFEIKGAKAGQLLCVRIVSVDVADKGAMVALPGYGVFGKLFTEPSGRLVEIRESRCVLWDGLELDVQPMVGKVGVAVPGVGPRSNTVGDHGGNMDCKMVKPGSAVFLPILVDGAMLYLGDAHARQADGECLMTAVEVEARITFECSILESIGSRVPLVNADGNIMTIGHGSTLDGAVDIAFQEMHALLTRAQGWSSADTAMFMSATADVSVCQVVNPRASARVSVPAQYLSPLLPTAR